MAGVMHYHSPVQPTGWEADLRKYIDCSVVRLMWDEHEIQRPPLQYILIVSKKRRLHECMYGIDQQIHRRVSHTTDSVSNEVILCYISYIRIHAMQLAGPRNDSPEALHHAEQVFFSTPKSGPALEAIT